MSVILRGVLFSTWILMQQWYNFSQTSFVISMVIDICTLYVRRWERNYRKKCKNWSFISSVLSASAIEVAFHIRTFGIYIHGFSKALSRQIRANWFDKGILAKSGKTTRKLLLFSYNIIVLEEANLQALWISKKTEHFGSDSVVVDKFTTVELKYWGQISIKN